jgi:hypothetical protein
MLDKVTDEGIVELKKVLAEDQSGDATRAIIQCLRDAATPISKSLRGSLSHDEYMLSEDLLQAINAAERVLSSTWEQLHPGQPFSS